MGNFEEGGSIIRYIAPKIKVLFKPSEALERAINEDDFTPPNRRKKIKIKSTNCKRIQWTS